MTPPGSPTFVRLLTPAGAGALAVLRLEGPQSSQIVDAVLRLRAGPPLGETPLDRPRYGPIAAGSEIVDDVVAYRIAEIPGPASEICCHGGVRVVERIIEALERAGAVYAAASDEPRPSPVWPAASQAEHELLEMLGRAKTPRAVRFLGFQLAHVDALNEILSANESHPETLRRTLRALMVHSDAAVKLVNGLTIAIVGPPNAGKSTLFNSLVGREAAISSVVAGTTRDWVEATIELDGFPVTLVDTAGFGNARSDLERLAIEAGRQRVAGADAIIGLVDGTDPHYRERISQILAGFPGPPMVVGVNKSDHPEFRGSPTEDGGDPRVPQVLLSSRCGEGLGSLIDNLQIAAGIAGFDDVALTCFSPAALERVRPALSDEADELADVEEWLRRWAGPDKTGGFGRL